MLCSRVIHEVQVTQPEVAVATHFYHFDEGFSLHDVYRTIAHQILSKLWASHSKFQLWYTSWYKDPPTHRAMS